MKIFIKTTAAHVPNKSQYKLPIHQYLTTTDLRTTFVIGAGTN